MKIQNITINKYKAFTDNKPISIGGKNIFIYGENGSGKSSLYYALKDFFQSSVEPIDMVSLRNFTLNDGGNDCAIKVEFDNEQKYTLDESNKDTNITSIIDANRLKSFLTYKHLIDVHNVKKRNEIDVFDLMVNGVLKHFKSPTLTNGIELGVLWKDLLDESRKEYGKKGNPFYHATQKKKSVDRKLEKFNNAINNLFVSGKPEYLAPDVNKILNKLSPGLNIEFTRRLPIIDREGKIIIPCSILLNVSMKRISLNDKKPQYSLNEAKLSAIAISIFLAMVIKQSPFSPDIKPLFLDDILIGLDSENRIRLLDLLQEKDVTENEKQFKDFQIFITTYDRHWYEVAKLHLQDWSFIEFYKGDNGPVIVYSHNTFLEKARAYFDAYDFPACANYLRKECERALKSKLPLPYTIGDGIKELVKPPKLETLIDNLKLYYEDLGIQPPVELIQALQNYKCILFNPMSHSDIESPVYKHDLELAFKTIEELNSIVLPVKSIIFEKGTVFSLNLIDIQYNAELLLAQNVYLVNNNGAKTISPISFYFNRWERDGVVYAKDIDSPPKPYSDIQRLEKIKSSPFDLNKMVVGINITYTDRNLPNIDEVILKKNLLLREDTLLDILDLQLN